MNSHDIILLGERHGDKNSEKIKTILQRFNTNVTFLLELSQNVKPYLNAYLDNGDEELFEIEEIKKNPNKITEDLLNLLKDIRKKHEIAYLPSLDVKNEEWPGDAIDKAIATYIERLDTPVIALLGETHASKKKIDLDKPGIPAEIKNTYRNAMMKPVGYHLKDKAWSIHLGKKQDGYDEHL